MVRLYCTIDRDCFLRSADGSSMYAVATTEVTLDQQSYVLTTTLNPEPYSLNPELHVGSSLEQSQWPPPEPDTFAWQGYMGDRENPAQLVGYRIFQMV